MANSTNALIVVTITFSAFNVFLCCGGDPIRPVPYTPRDGVPSVSNDGSRIAYSSYGEGALPVGIYMIDSAGNQLDFFIAGGIAPEWGPGDSLLLYTDIVDHHMRIYNFNQQTETIFSDSTEDWRPDFDPATKVLVFDRYSSGGSNLLTFHPATGELNLLLHRGLEPSWSPTGDRVAFRYFVGQDPRMFVLDLASGQVDTLQSIGNDVHFPIFAPDGNSLYFHKTEEKQLYPEIANIDLSTRRVRRVVQMGSDPDISREMNALFFAAPDSREVECIWKLDLSNDKRTQLTY